MSPAPGWLRRQLTHALLSGALPPRLGRAVHRRLGADRDRDGAAWRAYYNELRAAERAATGEDCLTESQLDLIEGAVLADVRAAPRERPFTSWKMTAALASAALAVVVVLVASSAGHDELVARGSGAPAIGLRVRCLSDAPPSQAPEVIASSVLGAASAARSLRCPDASLLAFSVTNLSEETAQVFLVGVREDGELLWFAPFEQQGASVAVPAGASDQLLEVVAATGSMDLGKRVALFALFDDRPMEGAALARELSGARARGLTLHGLDRLPLDVAAQSRAELIVVASEER